jgi:hypothetical protein
MDVDQQVVFFTPRGRALFDAPPVGEGCMAGVSEDPEAGLESAPQLRPYHLEGASRWTRDGDIPWAEEARAWEALDSG